MTLPPDENPQSEPPAPPTAPMTPVPPPYQSTDPYPGGTGAAYPGGTPLPPQPQPPPAPAGGYSVPPSGYPYPAMAAGPGDPLVLAPGASFSAWFGKVQEVGRRSWKSALIITGFGIAVPRAIVSLVQTVAGAGNYFSGTAMLHAGSLIGDLGSVLLGLFLTIIFSIAALFVAAAAWAAGTWALTVEATGAKADLGEAFRYGMKRALSLGGWTVVTGLIVLVGFCACILPSLYLSFALCLFGFVVIYERGQNPISRSFQLTHADFGPTLGKYAITVAICFVYTIIVALIFGGIAAALVLTSGTAASSFAAGVVGAIGALFGAPVYAVALIALLPTYAQLRARQAPLSTAQLRQELGG